MFPQFIMGEELSAHHAFAQAHRIGREIAVGEDDNEYLANPVVPHLE
jgi:hypothetical protein